MFGGTISGGSQNSFAPIGNLGLISNTGAFFAVLPAYTLNVFTNYTLQKQAQYNLEAMENAELAVRLAVIGQVVSAYFADLAQNQLVEQFTALNKDLTELISIFKALDKQGLTNDISINEIQSKQLLVEGQLLLAQNNRIATQNALRYLLNQPPGKVISSNKFAKINPYQIIPGNLPVSVIAARPDILKAEAELKAANEGISVASSSILPSVNLNYFYATGSGSQTFNNSAGSVGNNSSNTQSYYAAYANWNIVPSTFGQIDTNSAIFKASLANYKNVVNNALHEVDNSLAANNGYNQKFDSNQKAYASIKSKVTTKEAMYRRGISTYGMVLEAEIEQTVMAIDLTQLKLQQLISAVNLYQNLGGGYKYATDKKNNPSDVK